MFYFFLIAAYEFCGQQIKIGNIYSYHNNTYSFQSQR